MKQSIWPLQFAFWTLNDSDQSNTVMLLFTFDDEYVDLDAEDDDKENDVDDNCTLLSIIRQFFL